ncbi:MAG: hypothetical protein ABI566_05485 [Pseudolysinimonas sp.]
MSGEVSLERPAGAPVLVELQGRVRGQCDEVFAALAERVDVHGQGSFVAESVSRRAVVQGGYWYRGEYAVEPSGDGALITYAIVNIAPGWRLIGALTGRSAVRAAPAEFSRLLDELGAAVG